MLSGRELALLGRRGSSRGLLGFAFCFYFIIWGWAGAMEWQETSFEWCSVSHPSCLCFISGPWRNSILWGLAGQLVTGPAEAWRPPSAARSAQTVTQDGPPHVVSWGERIPHAWREHQTRGSQGEASRGAGRGRLSTRKGSFRNGVEGSYLKRI